MATQKSCSGSTNIVGWTIPSSSCIYQLTLTIDLTPITTTVSVNNGMTPAQVASLLNANRTGNTTGTISAQIVGANLQITISGVILPNSSLELFNYMIGGTGFPCGDFPVQLPSALVCSIIPTKRPKKRNGAVNISGMECPLTIDVVIVTNLIPPQTIDSGICGMYSNPIFVRENIYRYTKNNIKK